MGVVRALNEIAYLGADIEHVLQSLPVGLHLRKRHQTVGFLRGGFRSFERVEIRGRFQIIYIDCIAGIVAGKRTSVPLPTNSDT